MHFSDNKRDIGKSVAEKVKVTTSLNVMPTVPLPDAEPEQNHSFTHDAKNKQPIAQNKNTANNPVDHRCALAHKIINGEVALVNGLKTSAHEIKVAKRDISKFCN